MTRTTKHLRPHDSMPAKVSRPVFSQLLERRRLFTVLDATERGVVWINAPPGSGKTSLASDYVDRRRQACLWYRLDATDTDVGNFFHYLRIAAWPSSQRHAPPRFVPGDLASVLAYAHRFFEKLFAGLGKSGLLVFDDGQALPSDAGIHALLANAAERMPRGTRMLVLSREPPPAAFARLCAHGDMAVIPAEALRFTYGEARELAARKGMATASHDAVATLHEVTGGWAAGLTLLIERGNRPLPDELPDATMMQVLFDYFSHEIFATFDDAMQRQLVECALLARMDASAVRQLTCGDVAAGMLAELCRRGYFTASDGNVPPSYRFHPLFRAFLLERARTMLPTRALAALQRRAAGILIECGDIEDAVAMLVDAADWPTLANVILGAARDYAREGRFKTLATWIGQLPPDVVERTSWLLYWLGCCEFPFTPVRAGATWRRAWKLFDASQDVAGLYLCWARVARLYCFAVFSSREALAWLATFEVLQADHPEFPSATIEAEVAASIISLMRLYRLDHAQLRHWLDRGRVLLAEIDDTVARLMAVHEICWCWSWLGRTADGALLLRETAHLVSPDVPPFARLTWMLAEVIYAWHRADSAAGAAVVAAATRIADATGVHVLDGYFCTLGGYAALAVGDLATAEALRVRLENASRRSLDDAAFFHLDALVCLHAGRFDDADASARRALEHAQAVNVTFLRFLGHLCLASCLLERAQLDAAQTHLDRGFALVAAVGSDVMAHLHLLGTALIEYKRGRVGPALQVLAAALQRAEAVGGHYTPFYHRRSLAALYAAALDANVATRSIQAQVRRQRLLPAEPFAAVDDWPWPLRIYTLGRFAVARDGVSVKLGAKASRKPLQLLQVLIACGGRDVAQDVLPAAGWPDADGDYARHALETTLYRLRKLVGAQVLRVKDGSVTLDAACCWVDCWTLERVLSALDDAVDARAANDVERLLRLASRLHHGPFLALADDVPLTGRQRERLRARLLRSLERAGAFWGEHRQPDKAADCYLRALEVDPAAEALHRRLIRHYLSEQRYGEGMAAFARCARTLHDLLGIAPSPATLAVHRALLEAAKAHAAGNP